MIGEHSSIEEARTVCEIALQAPVYSEADYEAILEMLEDAHGTVRRVFVGGQEPSVPDDWRIDGLLYRDIDNLLVGTKTKLLQRYRASKFFAGQRRVDKANKKAHDNLDQRNWKDLGGTQVLEFKDRNGNVHEYKENVGEAAYLRLKQQGFDVRKIGSRYQYTTVKEIPKGKTQA